MCKFRMTATWEAQPKGLPGRILVASVEICAKGGRWVHCLPLALWGSRVQKRVAQWQRAGTFSFGKSLGLGRGLAVYCDKTSPWSLRVRAPLAVQLESGARLVPRRAAGPAQAL